jgi:UDP-N-acetylglucosamine 2-epimerase (non-hydrolysing)
MGNYENVLLKEKSDLCLVVGDVTSTMACSIHLERLLASQ